MLYILIPVFNELNNLDALAKELISVDVNLDKFYVFSDDGSTDGTKERIKELFNDVPYVIVGDGTNNGPGFAFNLGFEWILKHSINDKDIVVTMEADCTSDITLLNKMVSINQLGFDLVLASVYAQGGGFSKTTFLRKLLSSIANLIFRFLFDIKVLTISSFYRIYSIEILRRIQKNNKEIIHEKGFICMLEILLKAIKQNALIIEVPMVLNSNKRVGKSKMKLIKTTMEYFKFLIKSR